MGWLSFVTPHLYVDSVFELQPDALRRRGLDALLLDVDCTLKRYSHSSVSPEVVAWLAGLRAAGIALCLISNGLAARIRPLAAELAIPFVARACKPLPFGCRKAVGQLGVARKRTAIVGDQLFADVMAGRLAGLFTILVRPIHPEEEPWFTQLKRPWESRVLSRLRPDYKSIDEMIDRL